MSLAPDLQDIFGSYEFCEEERKQLINLLGENNRQYEKEIASGKTDYSRANALLGGLSNDANDFFNEYCGYTIAWQYSTQDIIDANNEIINQLKGE